MKFAVRLIFILLSVAYPFLVYLGLESEHKPWLLILLSSLMISRVWLAKSAIERLAAIVLLLALAVIMSVTGVNEGLKLYPVVINLLLLFVFAVSLMTGVPIIERLARIREPNLPKSAIAYTRKVTKAWCLFFILNTCVSAVTVIWTDEQTWLLYNGVIAYALIALMFAAEWLIRQRFRAKMS